MSPAACRLATSTVLVALVFLCLSRELFLAPLRPGGSWAVLKVLPLLAPLFGVLRGKRYTYQWSTLLIWPDVAEGAARAYADRGWSAELALAEAILAVAYFGFAVAYVRSTRVG